MLVNVILTLGLGIIILLLSCNLIAVPFAFFGYLPIVGWSLFTIFSVYYSYVNIEVLMQDKVNYLVLIPVGVAVFSWLVIPFKAYYNYKIKMRRFNAQKAYFEYNNQPFEMFIQPPTRTTFPDYLHYCGISAMCIWIVPSLFYLAIKL